MAKPGVRKSIYQDENINLAMFYSHRLTVPHAGVELVLVRRTAVLPAEQEVADVRPLLRRLGAAPSARQTRR